MLGKRYVAVLQLHGSGQRPFIDHGMHPAKEDAAEAHTSYVHPRARTVSILEVDLDALLPVDATDEQRAMHAERQALHWAAEFDRLAPCLGGHPAKTKEIDVDLTLGDRDALVEIRKALKTTWDTPTRWFATLDKLIAGLPRRTS